jgi:hypothetical protein
MKGSNPFAFFKVNLAKAAASGYTPVQGGFALIQTPRGLEHRPTPDPTSRKVPGLQRGDRQPRVDWRALERRISDPSVFKLLNRRPREEEQLAAKSSAIAARGRGGGNG